MRTWWLILLLAAGALSSQAGSSEHLLASYEAKIAACHQQQSQAPESNEDNLGYYCEFSLIPEARDSASDDEVARSLFVTWYANYLGYLPTSDVIELFSRYASITAKQDQDLSKQQCESNAYFYIRSKAEEVLQAPPLEQDCLSWAESACSKQVDIWNLASKLPRKQEPQ